VRGQELAQQNGHRRASGLDNATDAQAAMVVACAILTK